MESSIKNVSESDLLREASNFNIIHSIHDSDLLFDYILNKAFYGDAKQAIPAYFSGGLSDATQAKQSFIRAKPLDEGKSTKILEFAAGYGRVSRHSHIVFSGHRYVACDIHPDAVNFMSSTLGIESIQSSHEPEALNAGNNYDYIFVLSLFSHLPHKSFGRWLAALYSLLAEDGIMLFTTHGDAACRKFPVPFESMLNKDLGWGYGNNSDQPDLDDKEYGTMIVTEGYVINALKNFCPNHQLIRFDSGCWFGLQDEWLIRKNPAH